MTKNHEITKFYVQYETVEERTEVVRKFEEFQGLNRLKCYKKRP